MPSVQIRELPTHLYRALKSHAKKDHRSLSQQAVITLARGLGLEESPVSRRKHLFKRINQQTITAGNLKDAVLLVREDRQR